MVFLRSKIKHALKSKSQFWVKETGRKKVQSYKTLENEHTNPQRQKSNQCLFLQGVNSEGWTTMVTGSFCSVVVSVAWRIPGTGKPGGLPSMGSHRVGHDSSDLAAAAVLVAQ